jgi:hypothetical protein
MYASVLALQVGWKGWKERHLSRDGLLGVQLVLRCPPLGASRIYSVPEECQGFLFLGVSGPIESWPLSRGTVTIKRVEDVLELSGELQLGEVDSTSQSPQTKAGTTPSLAVRKTRLEQNANTLREIQASGNLRAIPELGAWAQASDGS